MGLRILHVISSVNTVGGGPIEGLTQLSIVNQKQGNSVEVVSLDDPDSTWVKSCALKCHAMGPSWLKYGYSPRLLPWLSANRHNYDVIIVNGLWQYSSFAVWRAVVGTPTPYFVFPHGMLDPWFKRAYPLKHLKKWLYWPWAEYRVLRDATAVLFTCENERRLARQSFWLYKCDEFVINYGTAAPAGDAVVQRQAFLEKFPQLTDKRCLLFLGRVHTKKAPDLLLEAFAEILSRRPVGQTANIQLVMAGPDDSAYAHEIKSMAESLGISDRITWTGMISGDIKWGAFYHADAFILPSHQENFGIAVAEALACGLPVLISNQVNIWREIQQANAGFVETDDWEGTRRLLERWLNTDQAAWNKMSQNAKAVFAARFKIEETAESFIKAMKIYGLSDLHNPITTTLGSNTR